MKFLSIRDGHDCNISYSDGKTVRYIKFERNYQKKHYNWGHEEGDQMEFLLKEAQRIWGIDFRDLNGIALVNDNAHHKLDRDIALNELYYVIDKEKNPFWAQFNCQVFKIDHHYAHMMSCWPLVNVQDVRTHFVVDGLGDHTRNTAVFQDNDLVDFIDRSQNMGISVILEQIGQQHGMKGMVLDISGKVMALKSYHQVPDQLTFDAMNLAKYLGLRNLNHFIEISKQLQGFIQPLPDDQQQLVNLAYLLHVFGEEKMPQYFRQFAKRDEVITYSGGTAQNTVINTKIKEAFPNSHIPPHCYDGGLSLGGVEFLRQLFKQDLFDNSNFPYWQSDEAPDSRPSEATIDKTAELLAQGKIVGWYQGNGEIGPRALGNRSILMDPSIKNGKDIINTKVKKREPYRPFGASVLAKYAGQHFDVDYESPYMLHVVNCLSDDFPSIQHVDKTCRIQTVNEDAQYSVYHSVIDKFREKTGIPMLLNTSLNVDGKPIAGYMEDAKTLFKDSDLDAVVIGDEIMVK